MSTGTSTAAAALVKEPSAAEVSSARYVKLFARRSEC